MYRKFEIAIKQLQGRAEYKNEILERKLAVFQRDLERKEMTLRELVQRSGLDQATVDNICKNMEEAIEAKNSILRNLKYSLAHAIADYKKFGEDAVTRSAKLSVTKAAASKALDGSLKTTEETHKKIEDLHSDMDELRKYLNPYVDKLIAGGPWPQSCKCQQKVKALLQKLQVELHLANFAVLSDAPKAALLRRSSKLATPDQEKYKLVRVVQQLEEKRDKLMKEKTDEITGYSQKQRVTLDRINVAKIKTNLKVNTERKYEDTDSSLEKVLKDQTDAAKAYQDSAKSQLVRLTKNQDDAMKQFADFKAELQKCKCL